ncbi:ribosome quality control complex subunit 1 [Staphylotrichum tortipilum]|uniref:Ribosome quality control complex subunit 1 n=1 Tax=Staphylotrichum tortipilum TaxID=2831512 RepID=A0AAN6RR07_9PEZI|nr:ribosome quality control complex subunit 1 [Staphylotrichum longicolle]
MASRQLRKLRKQQELLNLQNEQNEASEKSEESEDEPIVAKPRPNMFSGFAALGDDGDGDDDEEDDEEEQQQKGETENPKQAQHADQAEPAKKGKKKPKKKKKKSKQAEAPAPAQDDHESMDEIDRVLEELKLEAKRPGPSAATPLDPGATAISLNELLRINFQHLKAMNEMRRLFGKAVDAAEVEERAQENRQRALPENMDLETFLSAQAAHPGRGPAGNKSMFDTMLRTNPFIDGKKTWPRGTAQGLKMIRVSQGTQEDVEFAFAHDNIYDAMEGSFFGLVQMYDPMQIVHFLHRHPYHVSSLIQVSKVARQDQNSALAADLIERALFTFGRASLSEFRRKLEKGQARMSFARPENRQFYLAGYNLVQKLVLKGTYRTALEWAKLFLSINRDDPYAVLNWIHVHAIRAREAQWFVDFCNSELFDDAALTSRIYPKQSLPLALLQLQEPEAAQTALVKGMETLPWLYCALFSALNLDTPKSLWGIQPRDDDETLHTELYLHAAKDLWNTPQHISLLKTAAAQATRVTNPESSLPRGPRVTLSTARFIYLDNTPALMAAVPRQMLHHAAPNFDFDPLPPAQEANVFSTATQRLPWTTVEQARASLRGQGEGRDMNAAVARLQAEIEREVEVRFRRREGEGEEGGEGQGPPAMGIMNYLRYLIERGPGSGEPEEELGEFVVPTGMPGGWGEGEGWDEEEDDWGLDEFEGGDDFEGGSISEGEGESDSQGQGGRQ